MNRIIYKIVSIKKLKRVLVQIFNMHEEILFAYLYGSYASGRKIKFSDIDIGIFLKSDFIKPHLYHIDLCLEIEKQFENKVKIDLYILNDATPRFLFNIIKNGYVIYSKNETIWHEFEIKVISEYLDIKPLLDFYDKKLFMEVLGDKS